MMAVLRMVVPLVIAAAIAAPAGAQDGGQVVVDEVIARVNGDIVSRSQFNAKFEPIDRELSLRFSGEKLEQERARARRMIFNIIINHLVVRQHARANRLGFPENAFNDQVERIKRQIGAKSDEEFLRALADQGMTMEEFREQFAYQYYMQVLFSSEVGQDLYQSESRVQNYYEENIERYREPAKLRLSQIVFPLAGKSAEEVSVAAEAALRRLEAGDDFAEVYRASTPGAPDDADGDIGFVDLAAFRPELVDEIKSLEVGQHTGVIRTEGAFLILKLTERQEEKTIPLEQIKDRVLNDMQMDTYAREVGKYLTRLKKKSLISILADDFNGLYEETFYEGERRNR